MISVIDRTEWFALDEQAALVWLGRRHPDCLEEDGWDPREHGEEPAIQVMIGEAQRDGIISAPAGAEIFFEWSDEHYTWLLDEEFPGSTWPLRLMSRWEELLHIVGDGTTGIDAAYSILTEAVNVANALLKQIDQYIATRTAGSAKP